MNPTSLILKKNAKPWAGGFFFACTSVFSCQYAAQIWDHVWLTDGSWEKEAKYIKSSSFLSFPPVAFGSCPSLRLFRNAKDSKKSHPSHDSINVKWCRMLCWPGDLCGFPRKKHGRGEQFDKCIRPLATNIINDLAFSYWTWWVSTQGLIYCTVRATKKYLISFPSGALPYFCTCHVLP